ACAGSANAKPSSMAVVVLMVSPGIARVLSDESSPHFSQGRLRSPCERRTSLDDSMMHPENGRCDGSKADRRWPACGASGLGFTQPMEQPSASFQPGAADISAYGHRSITL